MISFLKQSRTLLTLRVLSEPCRSATVTTEQPSAELVCVSQKLGVNQIPLRLCELAEVVREETLGIYPYEEVTHYLDRQAARLNKVVPNSWMYHYEWRWRPVKTYSSRHWETPHFMDRIYDKAIPGPALLTMAKILERIQEAEFYVSDLRDYQDPFLAVTVPGSDTLFVIERWDEPSFRSGTL